MTKHFELNFALTSIFKISFSSFNETKQKFKSQTAAFSHLAGYKVPHKASFAI